MPRRKSNQQLTSSWDTFERPEVGQIFEHYKGGRYQIVDTGFVENSEEPCVIYRSLEHGIVWVRVAKDFLQDVEYDGVLRPRFVLVSV